MKERQEHNTKAESLINLIDVLYGIKKKKGPKADIHLQSLKEPFRKLQFGRHQAVMQFMASSNTNSNLYTTD